jgi:hypothetical protein
MFSEQLTKRDLACCFIESSIFSAGTERKILARVDNRLYPLLQDGEIYCGISYAPVYCQLVGQHLLKLRERYCKRMKIILAQPDEDFVDAFSGEQKRVYFALKMSVDKVSPCDGGKCAMQTLQACNEHLVNSSRYCISYVSSPTDAGAAGVRYAIKEGLAVYNASQWDIEFL